MDLLQSLFSQGQGADSDEEESSIFDKKDISSLAKYIKSDACRNVFLMLGAGISTSAGIPDFRSPDTGLYANLARLNLPYPEAVFEINFFRRNPQPFYALAKELYPGKYRPTISHAFIKLLAEKNLLKMCFTQNIDTLERRAGVPVEKIIEAHGSFASQHCIDCGKSYPDDKIRRFVQEGNIPHCKKCDGLVKPDIVFFGESLPESFNRSVPKLRMADLLIVMGTSLTVHPFANLATMVDSTCPRVLINLENVGSFAYDGRPNDIVLLGKCDDMVKELCKELGWEEDLMRIWEGTASSVETETGAAVKSDPEPTQEEPAVKVEDEVERLTEDVERALQISGRAEGEAVDEAATKGSEGIATLEEKAVDVDSPSVEPEESKEHGKHGDADASETKL